MEDSPLALLPYFPRVLSALEKVSGLSRAFLVKDYALDADAEKKLKGLFCDLKIKHEFGKSCLPCESSKKDAVLFLDEHGLSALEEAAAQLEGEVQARVKAIVAAVANYFSKALLLEGPGFSIRIGDRTAIMGILNVTPDSFSDGGRFFSRELAVKRGVEMAQQGADIIDVGGESTRPGSDPVPAEEEQRRVVPVIENLAGKTGVPISVDTYKAEVARAALEAGASMVNDVTALRGDPEMADVVVERKSAVVLMHMQGTPKTMQVNPTYVSVVDEVYQFLYARAVFAISRGVARESIVIDPGIGFGKTLKHNLALLRELKSFCSLGFPVLVGPSRKSFIGALSGGIGPEERLEGTLASISACALGGASIVRVHDVKEARRALDIADAIKNGGAK